MRFRILFTATLFLSLSIISVGHTDVTMEQVKEEIQKEIQPISKPAYNQSVFNPAMGLVLDAAVSNTTLNRGNFDFRSAELNLQSAVDPFANLFAVINGTKDNVSVEEAFFMTTSLPGVTIRGGRMFASFGRFPHWHDHELPFVNRTPSLDRFIGAEAQADGVEIMHLFKTPFFLQGTLGSYNKIGADNNRLHSNTGSGAADGRHWNEFTYLARLFSYVPMGDNVGIDLGLSEAVTPVAHIIGGTEMQFNHSARSLTGLDVTFRYEPLQNNVYRKLIWGSEVFRNTELRQINTAGDSGALVTTYPRKTAWGGYSYIDWRFSRWFSTGPFYDVAEDLDNPSVKTKTTGGMLNLIASEFQRIRLQVSQAATDNLKTDNQVYLQWFLTIGTHVHVFKDR